MLIAGVDEVGRGPLAGPVLAAAVILDEENPIVGLRDSKQLSAAQRETLFLEIYKKSLCVSVGRAEVDEIETENILQASLNAMTRAIQQLTIVPDEIWVDGIHAPKTHLPVKTVIQGDRLVQAISAASIVAKVLRDREMIAYAQEFPGYGFDQHKGYPTALHRAAIERLGITRIHRKTFSPIKEMLCL